MRISANRLREIFRSPESADSLEICDLIAEVCECRGIRKLNPPPGEIGITRRAELMNAPELATPAEVGALLAENRSQLQDINRLREQHEALEALKAISIRKALGVLGGGWKH